MAVDLKKLAELMSKSWSWEGSGGSSGLPSGATANQQLVTDTNGNPMWDDRRHWLELAEICPEILTDPDVKIYYDPAKTEIGKTEYRNNAEIDVAYYPNVKTVEQAAFQQSSVQYAIFPKADSLQMGALQRCANLKEVFLPKVTTLSKGAEFQNCTALEKVHLPELVTLSGGSVFGGCSKLSVLDLPKVTTFNGRCIDARATNLKTLILRSETMCVMTEAWVDTTTFGSGTGYIYVPAALIEDYKAAANWSTYAAQFRAIEDYPEICDPTMDDPITKGEAIALVNGAGGSVKTVNGVEPDESGNVQIEVGGSNGSSGFIYNADAGSIDQSAHSGDTSIFAVNYPSAEFIGDYAFDNCRGLAYVNLPMSMSIGKYAFSECVALETVHVGNFVTIADGTFSSCNRLKAFEAHINEIPQKAFSGCESLEYVNCEGVNSIASFAFKGCSSLKKLDCGAYLTSIASQAFDSSGIETLIIRGNTSVCANVYANGLAYTPIDRGEGYIYVPSSMVQSYKTHEQWSKYAAQIRAIEDYPDICDSSDDAYITEAQANSLIDAKLGVIENGNY